MLPCRGTLRLYGSFDGEIILIPSWQWHSLRREGGYQEADRWRAVWALNRLSEFDLMKVRGFVADAELRCPDRMYALPQLSDHEVRSAIIRAIEDHRIIAIRKGAGPTRRTQGKGFSVELRRLIEQVEKAGRLFVQGRHYKLVMADDLALQTRDNFAVVSQTEAHAVLDILAKEFPASADVLGQAAEKIGKDWRPSVLEPERLVLLRCMPAPVTAPKADDAPAITPSQVKALLDADKPVTFFARFVDEHGKGLSGFTGTLAHGSDPDSDIAFPDSGFATVTLKGEKQAWLTLPDDATKDLMVTLKERWKEIGGKVDEDRKAKEETLLEVRLQKGKLPELELRDGKKHTFMFRPPVAMARLHGMYFDTNKCFLLPTATPSLKKLVDISKLYPDSEVLVVAHTDTAGKESYNLELSVERADAMRAYLRKDVEAWLTWYDKGVSDAKRWGDREDVMMIDSLVPEEDFGEQPRVTAYQSWHNGEPGDAREQQPRAKPDGWEELKVDGIMGPKTRRQLVLDYMSFAGTTLPSDTRMVTYGCGEHFPLIEADGDLDADAQDGQHVGFDRRVEIFFFTKPFGILPMVPGVAEGESNKKAVADDKGSELYPEWRLRSSHDHTIQPGDAAPAVVVEWPDYLSDSLPDDLAIELVADDVAQTIAWPEAVVVDGYRRFAVDADPSGATYTLVAHAGGDRLLLWDDVALDDPENPPVWENLVSDLAREPESEPTGEEPAPEEPAIEESLPDDLAPLMSDSLFEDSDDNQAEAEQPTGLDGTPNPIPTWMTTLHAIDDLD
jgi:outer membrane protein OmpA-like peptidoglycan-associated protein